MATDKHKEHIADTTRELLTQAGFVAKVSIDDSQEAHKSFFVVHVDSQDDLSLLIGKNGQNLSAVEHLVRTIASKTASGSEGVNFIIDIDNYRKSRADNIIRLAQDTAQRVIHSRRAEAMAPMTAYERRLVHMELASCSEIQTESIGEEPRRRIVIKPEVLL